MKLESYVEFTHVDALDFFKNYSTRVDMVFLDDNLEYPYIKQEIQAALPIVKPGGIIAGHDFWNQNSTNVAL